MRFFKSKREDGRVAQLERELLAKDNQISYLIRTIRETDDIIFSISQTTNWESMRPRVATLVDQMTTRKVAESRRISSLIQEELIATYNPRRLEHKK